MSTKTLLQIYTLDRKGRVVEFAKDETIAKKNFRDYLKKTEKDLNLVAKYMVTPSYLIVEQLLAIYNYKENKLIEINQVAEDDNGKIVMS